MFPVQEGRADDVAYVGDVIASCRGAVCTDETRSTATGFSGGGRMTSLLGCRLGSAHRGHRAGVRARFPGPCNGRRVPVLTFHGLADPQNPYDGHAEGRGAGVASRASPEALAGWARHNSCKGDVMLDDPPGPLSTMRYEGCADGTEVRDDSHRRSLAMRGQGKEVDTNRCHVAIFQEPSPESITSFIGVAGANAK